MADAAPRAVTPPPDAEDADGGKSKRTDGGKPKNKPRGRPLALETELNEFFTQMGAAVMMVNQFDGMVIINQADENAKALAKLANKNARVKQALEALVNVSSMGAVVGVIGGTAIPILMNHNIVPVQLPMPSEWLEPPNRIQFKEELERKMEEQRAADPRRNGDGI